MVSVALIVVGGTNHSPVHFGLPRVAKNFLDLRLALYRVQLVLVVMGLVELVVLGIVVSFTNHVSHLSTSMQPASCGCQQESFLLVTWGEN